MKVIKEFIAVITISFAFMMILLFPAFLLSLLGMKYEGAITTLILALLGFGFFLLVHNSIFDPFMKFVVRVLKLNW